MLKLLQKNQQTFIVFVILYCILTVFLSYSLSSAESDPTQLFHLTLFANLGRYVPITHLTSSIFTICTAAGLLFIGFYLVRIIINYLIIQKRMQFPALFLVSISSLAFHQHLFSTALVASLFLLLAIDRVFSSLERTSPSLRYLDAGILITIGSLFYCNLIFFLPFFLIAQFTLKQFNWKEFLYPIIGLIVPFIYICSGYFLFGRPIIPDFKAVFQQLFFKKTEIYYSWLFLTGIGIYLLVMIIANFFAIRKYTITKIQSRKFYQLIFYLFLFSLAVFLLIPSAGTEMFFIISIPSAVLLSIYFSECRNSIINQILFVLLLLVPLVMNVLLGIKH